MGGSKPMSGGDPLFIVEVLGRAWGSLLLRPYVFGFLAVYLLALAHVVGAGTDGRSPWMLALLAVLVAPNAAARTPRNTAS